MDKQIKYLLGLLILLLITAYFLSLLSGLPRYFKDDIIAFLEERFEGEISFSSVSLWPLNRIRLNQFEFTNGEGSYFKAEALNLDYSLNFRDDEIIEIEFIELLGAKIEVQNQLNQFLNLTDNSDGTQNPDSTENLRTVLNDPDFLTELNLPDYLSDLKVNIRNSSLNLSSEAVDLKLTDLQLGLTAEAGSIYTLNITTALKLNQLQLAGGRNLINFNINKLELQFDRKNSRAELYFYARDFRMAELAANIAVSEFNYQGFELDLETLRGLSSARGEISFKNHRLQDYKAQLDIENLALMSSYSSQPAQKEDIKLTAPILNIQLAGPEMKLSIAESRVFLDQNPVDLSFNWKQTQDYDLKLRAQNFKFDYKFLRPYLYKGSFDFALQLAAESNRIQTARAEVSASELKSDYSNLERAEISLMLAQNEIFVNRAEFIMGEDNQLNLKGSYNLTEKNYLLSAEAEDFIISEKILSQLSQIEYFENNNYLSQIDRIKDRNLNFKIDAAGIYNGIDAISVNGDFNLAFKTAASNSDFEVDSSFWYTDNKLFLNALKLNSDYGQLDLMGELDFDTQSIQLRYAARNLEADLLNEFTADHLELLKELDSDIDYVEGSISNSFSSPSASIHLKMSELNYDSYQLRDLNLSADYENDNLKINNFQAGIAQAGISASGEIRKISSLEQAELDLKLNSQDLYFQDLEDFSSQEIPLNGEVQLQAGIKGSLADYDLDLKFAAGNSILQLDGQEIEFSKLEAEISRTNGDFIVENLTAEQQNLSLKAVGSFNFEEGFDIDLSLSGFEPADYLNNYQYASDIDGSLSLEGHLRGALEKPVFDFQLQSKNLSYAELDLEIGDNFLSFIVNENKILIDRFNFAVDSGSYNLSGQIFDINSKLKSTLNLKLIEVPTRELTRKFIDFYPLTSEFIFTGNVDLNSQGRDYQARMDISASSKSGQGSLNLAGTINDSLSLNFEGSGIRIDFSSRQYDFNLNLKSLVDFSGTVEGSLSSPVVRFDHKLRELSVNNNLLDQVEGEVILESNRRFSISEIINYRQGGSLNLDGSYSMIDQELNLSSNLESLPLGFLVSFLGEDYSASGRINGSFRAEGSLESPTLSGNLDLEADTLELGLTDPIEDLDLKIDLQDRSAVIDNLSGRFAEGDFRIEGALNLSDPENAWDLSLSGQKLYFEQGSLAGDFDADLNFTGPLVNPLLEGDLLVYDFVIGIPFEWPENEVNPDAFVPELNLNIRPGENVTVENENMEILVENGSLNLQFNNQLEDPLAMEGRLRSEEGTFTYYNSRFRLENAEAVFTPVDEGDIPTLSVNAVTYAGGNEININLTGSADNMRITLSSNSDLTEDEILNLLSTRGALGSAIIGGEDIGIQNIIWQELMRIVNSFLQRGVISDLESDVATIFSLDRAEIDAFQYGLEREFAIYLGKNITDKLYLEYASFFDEEGRRGEISFQYKLTEPTVLKGTYFGDDEYQISIETEIEF